MEAVRRGDITDINQFKGYDLEQEDEMGRTALHWAVSERNYEAVTTLIEMGAELQPSDEDGVGPIDLVREAEDYNSKTIFARLLNAITLRQFQGGNE